MSVHHDFTTGSFDFRSLPGFSFLLDGINSALDCSGARAVATWASRTSFWPGGRGMDCRVFSAAVPATL